MGGREEGEERNGKGEDEQKGEGKETHVGRGRDGEKEREGGHVGWKNRCVRMYMCKLMKRGTKRMQDGEH